MMSMAGSSTSSSEPRYTIEQISLLHRLLRTGLTKQDIIHALDSMTKMDSELQDTTSSNYASTSQTPKTSSSPSAPSANPGIRVAPRGRNGLQGAAEDEGYESQGGLLQGMSQEIICGVENFNNVPHEDVENLFRRGPMTAKAEIRAFLNKYRLSQNQISMATGISQSYISSFLIHGFMMKRSTQALLYRWYIGKKKEMEELGVQPHFEPLTIVDSMPLTTRATELSQPYPSPNGDNFLPTFKRRERFTWRDNHVRILETYYSKNPYPNDFEREKITEACNSEQQQSGELLTENKWVTSSKVYNWFANRRKDANRRRRLGQGQRQEGELMGGNPDQQVVQNDHTSYASMSPPNLHVIEVRQNSDEDPHAEHNLTAHHQDVQVVELHMDDHGDDQHTTGQEDGSQGHVEEERAGRGGGGGDVKGYGGMNTIYTLIEAVQESDMAKNS